MKISLIGMSNVGKTYWSKKLESKGFIRLGCDDMIEQKMKKELEKLGFCGIHNMSKWLGQPYDKNYYKNSQKYLDFEKNVVSEIIQIINGYHKNGINFVVDTTGSLIYLDKEILLNLKNITKIILLDTPFPIQKKMFKAYIQNPKPVIWGKHFIYNHGQTYFEALTDCYPKLLAYRTSKYKEYADIAIDYSFQRSKNINTNIFIKFIQSRL